MQCAIPERVPKVMGADVEILNFMRGVDRAGGTSDEASRLLLRQVRGIPSRAAYAARPDPQDIGRKWLFNGSCVYIDLGHLEFCIPEVTNAWDYTATFHAQLKIVREAWRLANAGLRKGVSVQAMVCNSDGAVSWGSHLNYLVTRECYDNIFHHRLQYLLWLASYQACSVLIWGQGKVGSDNGMPRTDYQFGQRSDWIETVVSINTTFERPLINSRNEPLCDRDTRLARFHHIACDSNLCHVASVLKTGVLQILLDMVESESPLVRPDLILEDPVRANVVFSHDVEMRARERTLDGARVSALDLQRRYFEAAAKHVENGACDETVPRAREIVALWSSVLDQIEAGDMDSLSRRLDWALKRWILEGALDENPRLSWSSPEIKRLDLMYGSIDLNEGLYWAMEQAGCVERVVSDARIDRFVTHPPSDTRAYTRAHLLRRFGPADVADVDWDRVGVYDRSRGHYGLPRTVSLADPLGSTRAENGALFRPDRGVSARAILNALGAVPAAAPYRPVLAGDAQTQLIRSGVYDSYGPPYPGTDSRGTT